MRETEIAGELARVERSSVLRPHPVRLPAKANRFSDDGIATDDSLRPKRLALVDLTNLAIERQKVAQDAKTEHTSGQ